MSDPQPALQQRRWNHWYRHVFPAYWLFHFCGMHFPAPRLTDIPGSDWTAHLVAYTLLTFLLWRFCETFQRPLSRRFPWIAGISLAAYAVFDEWSQPFFNRSADIVDWLVDVTAISLTLIALEWWRRQGAARIQSFIRK